MVRIKNDGGATRRAETLSRTAITYLKGGDPSDTGFTPPGQPELVFINAERMEYLKSRNPKFSIGKPSEVFTDSFKDDPNSYTYTDDNRSNFRDKETLASVAAKHFGGIVPRANYSQAFANDVRSFEENTGLTVRTFYVPGGNDYRGHSGFVYPDAPQVIFVNSAGHISATSQHKLQLSNENDPAIRETAEALGHVTVWSRDLADATRRFE